MTAEIRRNLEAAEMWFYLRMLRVSYVDRVTNELRNTAESRYEEGTAKDGQKTPSKVSGTFIRKGKLEDLCLSGEIEGRRARGAQRLTFL